MPRLLSAAVMLCCLASLTPAQTASGPPLTSTGKPLFTFRPTYWINLHHFLYVLGRAQNGEPDSHREAVATAPADKESLDAAGPAGRRAWGHAIAWYAANLSKKDAIFDDDLVAITNALAAAGDAPSLAGVAIPGALRAVLQEAAPVYRQVWWDRHARSNRARIDDWQPLLARYGGPISARLTRAYQQAWPPEGLQVQICAYANWAGSYSTAGRLIVMSSLDDALAGSQGLETVFHEAMHQWDDAVIPRLREAAQHAHAEIPPALFHSLIFYTAGYATAQVVPGHHPYADRLWARGLPAHAQLDQYWLPYLRGEGTLDEALTRLVRSFARRHPAP
jgi:hypothetical protein